MSVTVEILQWLATAAKAISASNRFHSGNVALTAPAVTLERLFDPIVAPTSHRSKFRSRRPVARRSGLASSASPLPPLSPKLHLHHDHQALCPLVPRWCVTPTTACCCLPPTDPVTLRNTRSLVLPSVATPAHRLTGLVPKMHRPQAPTLRPRPSRRFLRGLRAKVGHSSGVQFASPRRHRP